MIALPEMPLENALKRCRINKQVMCVCSQKCSESFVTDKPTVKLLYGELSFFRWNSSKDVARIADAGTEFHRSANWIYPDHPICSPPYVPNTATSLLVNIDVTL